MRFASHRQPAEEANQTRSGTNREKRKGSKAANEYLEGVQTPCIL